jgi:hypothetical protein
VNFALDDTVPLQLPELLGKHLRADLGNAPRQFAGAEGAVSQFKQNDRFPFSADVAEGRSDRTFLVFHRCTYFLVSIAQNSAYLSKTRNNIFCHFYGNNHA